MFQFRLANPTLNAIANAKPNVPIPAGRVVPIHGWRLVIIPCGLVLCLPQLPARSQFMAGAWPLYPVGWFCVYPSWTRSPNSWLTLGHCTLWAGFVSTPAGRETPIHGWRLVIVPWELVLCLYPIWPRDPNAWLALSHSTLGTGFVCVPD